MRGLDIILLAAILVVVALGMFWRRSRRKKGSGCCGSCSGRCGCCATGKKGQKKD